MTEHAYQAGEDWSANTIYTLDGKSRRVVTVWREHDCGCGGSYHGTCGDLRSREFEPVTKEQIAWVKFGDIPKRKGPKSE